MKGAEKCIGHVEVEHGDTERRWKGTEKHALETESARSKLCYCSTSAQLGGN